MYYTGNTGTRKPVCYVMRFDNQDWFREALYEAIASLSRSSNWEQVGDVTPQKAATLGAFALQYFDLAVDMIGMIMPFAGKYSDIPDGCFPCDGRSLNVQDYPLLAGKLGAFYPDDETFNVPDLRARFVIGMNDSSAGTNTPSRPSHTWQSTGGAETHVLTTAELPAHSHVDSGHTHTDTGHIHGYVPALPNLTTIGAGVPQATAIPGAASTTVGFANISSGNANIQNTGDGVAHSILNPFYSFAYVIVAVWGGQ